MDLIDETEWTGDRDGPEDGDGTGDGFRFTVKAFVVEG